MKIYCNCVDEYYHPRPMLEAWQDMWLCSPCIGRFDQETGGYPSSLFVDDFGIDAQSLLRSELIIFEEEE